MKIYCSRKSNLSNEDVINTFIPQNDVWVKIYPYNTYKGCYANFRSIDPILGSNAQQAVYVEILETDVDEALLGDWEAGVNILQILEASKDDYESLQFLAHRRIDSIRIPRPFEVLTTEELLEIGRNGKYGEQ